MTKLEEQIIKNCSRILNDMNKFCYLPFVSVCTERNGAIQACHQSHIYSDKNVYKDTIEEGWNSEYFRNLRKDLLNGVENPNCEVCWKTEAHGLDSKRMSTLRMMEHKMDDTFRAVLSDCNKNNGYLVLPPEQLDIKINNTCNLKCIMCNSYQSSQHETEVKQMREQDIEPPKVITLFESLYADKVHPGKGNLPNNIKGVLSTVERLLIDGGEPIISPDTRQLLDYCLDQGRTDIMISFITNIMNIPNGILEKLNKFSKVHLFISWDHLDADKFKFIRYPADYNIFLKNFDSVCEYKNIQLGISVAFSIFNIYEMPQILDHFEMLTQQGKLTKEVIFKLVLWPDYQSIAYLEPNQKLELVTMIAEYLIKNKNYAILQNNDTYTAIKNAIHLLTEPAPNFIETVKERTRSLEIYDKMRGTDYKTMFPYIRIYD